MNTILSCFTPFILTAALLICCATSSHAATTTRVSINSDGDEGNDGCHPFSPPALSDDARQVAFASLATNMVDNDTNTKQDIFVHERLTGVTSMVSGGDGDSYAPVITPDGRYVAFSSSSTQLVVNDTNAQQDVFVRDRKNGQTTRVSVASNGTQGNGSSQSVSISDDGRYVIFVSTASNLDNALIDSNNANDVFLHDRQTHTTTMISRAQSNTNPGNGDSVYPRISGDGRFVIFGSLATNLTSHTHTHTAYNLFVRDLQSATTSLVSVNLDGNPVSFGAMDAAISRDGRYVAFFSFASDLTTYDINGTNDLFIRDLATSQTTRIDFDINGYSFAHGRPSMSANGRFITFLARRVEGHDDVFLHDRQTAKTTLIGMNNNGDRPNDINPTINNHTLSPDGKYAAFTSPANDLVEDDTNFDSDVFLRGPFLVSSFPWAMFLPAMTKKK